METRAVEELAFYLKIILIWRLLSSYPTKWKICHCRYKTRWEKISLVNLYANNEDNPDFFHQFFEKLNELECETLLIGRDFNCATKSEFR